MLERYKGTIKKEALYYLLTLVVLALIMHIDLLSDPFARFETMQEKENYSHPFLYAFIVYSILFIVRKSIDLIGSLFTKKGS